MNHNLILNSSR